MDGITPRIRLSAEEYDHIQRMRAMQSNNNDEIAIAIGCSHIPFQDRQAMDGIKKLAMDIMPDQLIWVGDTIDCNALGHFERGLMSATGITLEEEYDDANVELDDWDRILKKGALKVYMFGNHENRYFKWQKHPDNAKYGELLSPIRGLELEERNYKVMTDYLNDVHQFGSFEIFHGDIANIHTAKKNMDTFRVNNIFAHSHRSQEYREGNLISINMGSLANFNAPAFNYADRSVKRKWANAFVVLVKYNGHTHATLINIIDGHFVFGGRKY